MTPYPRLGFLGQLCRGLCRAGVLLTALTTIGIGGCGKEPPKKTDDPATVEQLRQQHQEMSRREMRNE